MKDDTWKNFCFVPSDLIPMPVENTHVLTDGRTDGLLDVWYYTAIQNGWSAGVGMV